MFRATLLSAAIAVTAPSASAQTYPTRSETPITDDAGIIAPVAEARLAQRITQLEQDNGADIVVVTLPGAALSTMGDDPGVYARGLMEQWGLGDMTGGRVVLLLVFPDDRDLRLEIAGDFDDDLDAQARVIIDETILPQFRDDNYTAGINDGIEAVADRVLAAPAGAETATAQAEGGGVDEETGSGPILIWVGAAIAAIAAAIVGARRRAQAKLAATPCAKCGNTGLTRDRLTLTEATATAEGRGETRLACPFCGHVEATPFTISKKTPPPKPTKKGGGASGE